VFNKISDQSGTRLFNVGFDGTDEDNISHYFKFSQLKLSRFSYEGKTGEERNLVISKCTPMKPYQSSPFH